MSSACRCPVRFLALFIARYSPYRAFTSRCVLLAISQRPPWSLVKRCRRFRDAATGAEFHRWKLGFNQSRLHLASRTCGPSRYIPSRLAAFPTCAFPLRVSPPGWSAVLGGYRALDLLPLWGNLTCAEAAHHNTRDGIRAQGILHFFNSLPLHRFMESYPPDH